MLTCSDNKKTLQKYYNTSFEEFEKTDKQFYSWFHFSSVKVPTDPKWCREVKEIFLRFAIGKVWNVVRRRPRITDFNWKWTTCSLISNSLTYLISCQWLSLTLPSTSRHINVGRAAPKQNNTQATKGLPVNESKRQRSKKVHLNRSFSALFEAVAMPLSKS